MIYFFLGMYLSESPFLIWIMQAYATKNLIDWLVQHIFKVYELSCFLLKMISKKKNKEKTCS